MKGQGIAIASRDDKCEICGVPLSKHPKCQYCGLLFGEGHYSGVEAKDGLCRFCVREGKKGKKGKPYFDFKRGGRPRKVK